MSGALAGDLAGDLVAGAATQKATTPAPPPSSGSSMSFSAPKPHLPEAGTSFGGNRVLVAEFIACMVLIGCAPLVGAVEAPGPWLKKGSAVTGLFLILALVAAPGGRSARIAAAFGGLVTLATLISSRDLFAEVIALMGGAAGGGATGEAEGDTEELDIGEGAPGGDTG